MMNHSRWISIYKHLSTENPNFSSYLFPHAAAASTRSPLTTPGRCMRRRSPLLPRPLHAPPLTTSSSTPLHSLPRPSCACKARGARVPMTAAPARPTTWRCGASPRAGARSGGGRWPLARPCATCASWRWCGCAASVCCDNDDGDNDGATGSLVSSTTRGVVLMWHGMARWTDVPLGTARHG